MTREEALKKVEAYLTAYLPIKKADEIDKILFALQTDPCKTCQKVKTTFKQTANEWGVTCEPIAEPCEDCISRKTVIQMLYDMGLGDEKDGFSEYKSALWECKGRIDQIPSVVSSEDCISREKVFDMIDTCNSDGLKGIFCSFADGERFKGYIKELPSVQPKTDILDKITAEMQDYSNSFVLAKRIDLASAVSYCIGIIDKYRESEDKQ